MSGSPTTISFDLGASAAAGVAADDLPELLDGTPLDLPEGAKQNADGTITVTFDEPAVVRYKQNGTELPPRTFTEMTLRRLNGVDYRKIVAAKSTRGAEIALSRSAGVSEAMLALLYRVMAAPDLVKLRQSVNVLMDADGEGLPERATEHDDGSITLPLLYPCEDGEDTAHAELTFQKLKADSLIAMQNAKDLLATGLHRATGLTLKAASGMIDVMDAADISAVQRVIGFLSGIGRKSGG